MTALSADIDRPVRSPVGGVATAVVKLAGYTNRGSGNTAFTVYKGAIVACDVDDTDGYFGPFDFTAAAGDVFGGIAAEKVAVTSSDAADGSKLCTVYRNGVWGFPKGSLTITDVGAAVYASDTNTVTTTSTNNQWIGYIEDVDDTYVWVNIAPAFMMANSAT